MNPQRYDDSLRRTIYVLPILVSLLLSHAAMAQGTTTVFVGNQGNFSDANGSVTAFDPSTGLATQKAVPDLNTLVQSIALTDSEGYVMANTSDRVDIFDPITMARTGQILDISSPRYMAFLGGNRAYVSNLNDNAVSIIDLQTEAVTGTIPVGFNPEDIAVHGNRAYVANFGFGFSTTLSVIDTDTDTVVETREVGCDGPRFGAFDRQDELWVFCSGKTVYNADFTEIIEQTNGEVVVFDAAGTEVARMPLGAQIGSGSLGEDVFYSALAEKAFVLAGGSILVFDTAANAALTPVPIADATPAAAVAYDATVDRFYVAHVPSFTDAGYVSILDENGASVGQFDAGVAPASIALYQPGVHVAVEDRDDIPSGFSLDQNFPNPFRNRTTFGITLPISSHLMLAVYDMLGRRVAVLADETMAAGLHQIEWQADNLPSGLYFARMEAGGSTMSRLVTLIR